MVIYDVPKAAVERLAADDPDLMVRRAAQNALSRAVGGLDDVENPTARQQPRWPDDYSTAGLHGTGWM